MSRAYLVLETGETFVGRWLAGENQAGEVVFNTSHSGYEEIATDPSYFGQIMVMSAPQQGNYSVDKNVWESDQVWIQGFIALEIQNSEKDRSWIDRLSDYNLPVVDQLDTRKLILHLRDKGTTVGALVKADTEEQAIELAQSLMEAHKTMDSDWVYQVSTKEAYQVEGSDPNGPTFAVIDYGCKKNIIRELKKRCKNITVFPSRVSAETVLAGSFQGVMLSNGPGDPAKVQVAVETVKQLLGQLPIFGICMGHQILSQALGAETFKLKFGHRGSNQPVKDHSLNEIYMTSQNHGYAVAPSSLPKNVVISHTHLNDQTVSGINCSELQCMSVQFHPESHPGPRDAEGLFDYFIKQVQ